MLHSDVCETFEKIAPCCSCKERSRAKKSSLQFIVRALSSFLQDSNLYERQFPAVKGKKMRLATSVLFLFVSVSCPPDPGLGSGSRAGSVGPFVTSTAIWNISEGSGLDFQVSNCNEFCAKRCQPTRTTKSDDGCQLSTESPWELKNTVSVKTRGTIKEMLMDEALTLLFSFVRPLIHAIPTRAPS